MRQVAVVVDDDAKPDFPALCDKVVEKEAMRIALSLRDDPYQGEPLRYKSNLKPLAEADCRKIKFDKPGRSANAKPRYRYRLVYRIEPHEGSPHEAVIMSVGAKPSVYRDAAARAGRRLREQAVRAMRAARRSRRRD